MSLFSSKQEKEPVAPQRPAMRMPQPPRPEDFSSPAAVAAKPDVKISQNQSTSAQAPAAPRPQAAPQKQAQSMNIPGQAPEAAHPQIQKTVVSHIEVSNPKILTPEQHMAKIMSELEEAAQKPDLIPCEHLKDINDVPFSDIYITPDKKCYTWAGKSDAGLKIVDFEDYPEFLRQLENAYDGKNRSYLLTYKGRHYRVERTIADGGAQFCARKMPISVPNLRTLGLPEGLYRYLLSLSGRSGLILLAGPTGSGKSTTIAALLQEYLQIKGGYCFTIEDPIELPLDGVYLTPSDELGLCKQTTPPDGSWQEGIKSALRSKPRYIYLGEIRDPNVASEALRAATSGHLVLSTIHANNVSDSINSLVKYAASSGISEEMAYELVANGFLGCIHQILYGAPKKISVTYVFANPDLSAGCQVRSMLRNGKLNLSTIMEQQKIKIDKNMPVF